MWRIKTLTKLFGPVGLGWYYEEVEHWSEKILEDTAVYVKIHLYIKDGEEWSKPIVGIGGSRSVQVFQKGPKASDEGYKMALTDAISVACKALGIGADIYYSADASAKYAQYYDKTKATKDSRETALKKCKAAKSLEEIQALWGEYQGTYAQDREIVEVVNQVWAKFQPRQ